MEATLANSFVASGSFEIEAAGSGGISRRARGDLPVPTGAAERQELSEDGRDLNRLGTWLGAMAQSENAPPDETPPAGDRATAEAFGERVARVTLRFKRGA